MEWIVGITVVIVIAFSVIGAKKWKAGSKESPSGNNAVEIIELAKSGTEKDLVKLVRMFGEAANSNDIEAMGKIQSTLRTHVDQERYINAIRTLPMSEQVAILKAVKKYT